MAQRTTRRLSAGYLGAAVVFAIGMVGTTLPTPLYGLYREQLGFSEFMVTVVFAVYAFGVIAVLLLAGNFSDQVGRRPVLFIGLGLSAASAVCFLTEGGLPLLFAGRLLSGFAAGLFSGAATATVMELAPPGREARAGLAATAANMGGLGCGPLLAGLLAQYAPWPLLLPFYAALALVAVGAVVTWFLPEPVEHRTRRPRLRPQGLNVPPEVRGIFAPAALAAFSGFALLGLCTAVSPTFIATTLGEKNLAVSGVVVFSVFLASTVGQSMMGRVGADRALAVAVWCWWRGSYWWGRPCSWSRCRCWWSVWSAAGWARGWRSARPSPRSARRPRPGRVAARSPRSSSSPTSVSRCR